MGNVIMPKNSAVPEEILAALKIYYDTNDWLDNDAYKERLKAMIGDGQYASSYTKKAQMTSYFGFTEWEDISSSRSRRRITPSGKAMYEALTQENQEQIDALVMKSLETVLFGRNNVGAPKSDSDIEPPCLFIRASLALKGLTAEEFAYLLYGLSNEGKSYTDLINDVSEARSLDGLGALPEEAKKYTDWKPIIIMERWGFLQSESSSGKVFIANNVLERYYDRLSALAIYNVDKIVKPMSEYMQYSNSESLPNQRIFFGAPGTGKSYSLNDEANQLVNNNLDQIERVTFHPDYTYANFVGSYKPTMKTSKNDSGDRIAYEYVPGPFMQTLVKALNNPDKPYVLIVEEINRANVAAVFGDIFQLLDRKDDNTSEYRITTSADMQGYLERAVEGIDSTHLTLPSNLFIWATMNSADQGVYPMDTAFKRRWSFKYIGIDEEEGNLSNDAIIPKFNLGGDTVSWNVLRKAINEELSSEFYNINEDKLMGPFFLNDSALATQEYFEEAFKNKVLMYLFDDVVKQKRRQFFKGRSRYSDICKAFDTEGINIFPDSVINFVKQAIRENEHEEAEA